MEAQRSKAHHYLPQFYLKRFASRKKRNTHYIWRFDKRTGGKVEIDIAKVCHEKGFHEFTDTFGNVVRFEDNITQMEHNVSKSLEAICTDFSVRTLEANKEALANLLGFLMARSATVRKDLKDLGDEIVHRQAPAIAPGLELDEFTENHVKGLHYNLIREQTYEITKVLYGLKWVLMKNITPIQFITSDYPFAISRVSEDVQWPVEELADGVPTDALWLKTPGVMLFFPLTPRRMLLLCDPLAYDDMPPLVHPKPVSVQFANRGQVSRSQRFVFSHEDNFAFVERLIREHPELRDTDRARWRMTVKWEKVEGLTDA